MIMTLYIDELEQQRLNLQTLLDAQKTQEDRNRLGQFATPGLLARDILAYGLSLLPSSVPIRFMDPAIGTGSFYSALLATSAPRPIEAAKGFEFDAHYADPAQTLWANMPLQINQADFTRVTPPSHLASCYNLLICNPPYVRHHHLLPSEKLRLQAATQATFGTRIDGLAGLYCYFLALAHAWMQPGAIAIWLIPSEFMDVNYGRAVKHYLLNRVTLIHLHRFDPHVVQFDDALVSSAIVCFRNTPPPPKHTVMFSYGGALTTPLLTKHLPVEDLRRESKWTRFPRSEVRALAHGPLLGDYFQIKRGIATGDNKFFLLSPEQIEALKLPWECFQPILPSPRYITTEEILPDERGCPILDRQLFLLNCRLSEGEVQQRYPSLWAYLQSGKLKVATRYLCSKRTPWYSQEERPPTPFVCTYIGRSNTKRGKPFRFILNHSQATAANVYLLLYPRSALASALKADVTLTRRVWQWLNSIQIEQLLDEGRVYGGGLHKLEPSELAKVSADGLQTLLRERAPILTKQLGLFDDAA
jgi:adenine-specific DNA-methyltransferase